MSIASPHATGNDAPRVLIVTATDRRRGAEVFTERLGKGLTEHGWVVQTVSLTRSDDARLVEIEALTDVSSARPGRFNRRISRALAQRIREYAPDIVLANGGSTLRYGVVALLGGRSKLVYMAIGEPRYWLRSATARVANRLMLRRVDRVLAVCDATRRQLVEIEPSLMGRIDVTYTGVPDELFRLRRDSHEGPFRLLMLGNLSTEKNPLQALACVAEIPDVVLRYVGDGPLRGQMRAEIDIRDLGDRVELAGSVDDVNPHLEWADALLLTSHTEGLPGAVLEAGAAGLPAVAFDVGGVREAVSDGVSGLVVTPRSHEALVDAVSRLADDRDLARRLGAGARRHVRERFGVDLVIAGYSSRLTDVLG